MSLIEITCIRARAVHVGHSLPVTLTGWDVSQFAVCAL